MATQKVKLHNRDREHLEQLIDALYLMDAFQSHGGMDCEDLESYKALKTAMEVYLCERGILYEEEKDEAGNVTLYTFAGETGDKDFDAHLEEINPWG